MCVYIYIYIYTPSQGFLPICVRKLAWTTSFFVTYERLRVVLTPAPV